MSGQNTEYKVANRSLKIAMVLRLFSPSGGLELYALKLIEGLLANGHQITVICQKDESGLSHQALTVHTFEAPPKQMGKGQRLDYYYETASKLLTSLGPFDIVHSQHFPVQGADVVTFHNHTAKRLSQVGYPWERALNEIKLSVTRAYQTRHKYDAILSRTAKMRIFVGAVMKDDFYTCFSLPQGAPYTVAHPGASLMESTASQGEGEENDAAPFTFLFVGKGFRKKGLDTLLSSCRLLKQRGHNFTLHIAGIRASAAGNLHKDIFQLPVQYLGFRRDMPDVYSACQAIILPSKIEPFGMAPIQGMQFGLVPIVSRVCGVAEVLSDGKNALILKNHLDKKELADLMERLILDRELYKSLKSQAKTTADRLNWRQTVEATEKAYEQVLQDKQSGSA